MSYRNIRPPMSSDSDDDYDGFSFGDEFDEKKQNKTQLSSFQLMQQKEDEDFKKLINLLTNGDVVGLADFFSGRTNIDYNAHLRDGWTLLLHAVHNVKYDLVSYLISKGANVNSQADSITPLMIICKNDGNVNDNVNAVKITKLLLHEEAVVNIRDNTGTTPLMYACMQGNKDIVELLLGLSAIDAIDNYESTALFYAIENKQVEIVKMLIAIGADTKKTNSSGYTPRQAAIQIECYEIAELFEEEIMDHIPLEYTSYRTYHDLAPTVFPEHNIPAYSPDIHSILVGARAIECEKVVYDSNINLPELLTMDDNRLNAIGIVFEYQRKRILHALLKFHLHPFSYKSVRMFQKNESKNMYDYYTMYAEYLKHLIIMSSTITYLYRIGGPNRINKDIEQGIHMSLNDIQKNLDLLQKHVQHLSTFSQKNPLFIQSTESQNRKYKKIVRPFITYTIIIGFGVVGTYKLTKLFF